MIEDLVGEQFGNYRLVRLLEHTAFADLYLGEHLHLRTEAVIKVFHRTPGGLEALLSGLRRVALLKHPNIVRVLEFGVQGEAPFLVLDQRGSDSVRRRYPGGTVLPLEQVVVYARQSAAALQYAHEQGMLYGSIEPEHLLIGQGERVWLRDFSTAMFATRRAANQEQTDRGQESQEERDCSYMAPEQIQGHPCPASDQYALATVVYEWLSGRCPFHGSAREVLAQQMAAAPPSLHTSNSMLPREVAAVIQTALAFDPQRRFPSMSAFAEALLRASRPPENNHPALPTAMPGQLLPQTAAMATSPARKRVSTFVGVILFVCLTLVIGGAGSLLYALRVLPGTTHSASGTRAKAPLATLSPQTIYQQATSGKPFIDDALDQPGKSTWKEAQSSCTFQAGAYHVVSDIGLQRVCLSGAGDFSNFALQVQIIASKAVDGYGGIAFRANSDASQFYDFSINGAKQYTISLSTNDLSRPLENGTLPDTILAVSTIAVIARESDFYFYANGLYITSLHDTTLSAGALGFFVGGSGNNIEAVFSHVRIWK
ncbi:MAG TPA: serine/threonine-protein kinase [Ktedonosporobacter sp.]|nr:serine/threonine-protein kinase [Ktedonosporobacter sp.]